MNKSDLKNFAINARLELLRRVSDRAALYGISEKAVKDKSVVPSAAFHKIDGTPLTASESERRNALLVRASQIGYRPAMEEAAYTWFNRFVALKYLQEHNLLPVAMRVLPDTPGVQPQILREAQDVSLPNVDLGEILSMLDGNRTDELYKYLLLKLCAALSETLPGMFREISGATELLFPDGLLRADSVLGELANLPADCWSEIQVIGWLYQYYNTQLKDETFELLKKNVKITKDRIGAATQLFTPEWIVRYMVENSLGRLWLEGHPDENLRMKWRYFMDEAQQLPEVAARLAELRAPYASIQPEQLTVLDPCMGSGHILVYTFEVLMEIYRSVGYTDRDAAASIVENNLYGLDIDDRAAQLAYFAVMMKACEYDRRFLRRGVQPHVCAVQENAALPDETLAALGAERPLAERLLKIFVDAKEYGSLVHVDLTLAELERLDARLAELETAAPASLLTMADSARNATVLKPLVKQAKILARRYDAVITNPPYMGGSGMNDKLSRFVKDNYPDSKSDLFACFMEWGNKIVKQNGLNCMVTMQSWMFLSSFEQMRCHIIKANDILCLMHMENMVLGIAFGTAVTLLRNSHVSGYKGTYNQIKLCDIENEKPKTFPVAGNRFSQVSTDNFKKIPGSPIAYWVSEREAMAFKNGMPLETIGASRSGMQTGDNNLFLRFWHEVCYNNVKFDTAPMDNLWNIAQKWFPHPKGGPYRKWYGNLEYVVNFKNNGEDLRSFTGTSIIKNPQFYFRKGVCWSHTTSKCFSGRIMPEGCIFNVESPAFYPNKDEMLHYVLSFSNTKILDRLFGIISQTMHYMAGDMAKIPIIDCQSNEIKATISRLSETSVAKAQADWDSFETSWDFKKHPMI